MNRISQRSQRGLRYEQCLTSGLNFGVSNPCRGICSTLFRVYTRSGESLSKIPLLLALVHTYKVCVTKQATRSAAELSKNIHLKINLYKL